MPTIWTPSEDEINAPSMATLHLPDEDIWVWFDGQDANMEGWLKSKIVEHFKIKSYRTPMAENGFIKFSWGKTIHLLISSRERVEVIRTERANVVDATRALARKSPKDRREYRKGTGQTPEQT